MDYITTTQLRTKTRWLVETLEKGKTVYLIHRSRMIAEIIPINPPQSLKTSSRYKKKVSL